MKEFIKRTPVLGSVARSIHRAWRNPTRSFPGSTEYWQRRYKAGGTSGAGSYNELATFKAGVLNAFVGNNDIQTVLEYGCGDGNQLKLAKYQAYIGFDVSSIAIAHCASMFSDDKTKTFKLMGEYAGETAQLTLSLDVIYHLVEDDVFDRYMRLLFESSTRFVIIYSSNDDGCAPSQALHEKHRAFSKWVANNQLEWKLMRHIPNQYPYESDKDRGSLADFYIYARTDLETAIR